MAQSSVMLSLPQMVDLALHSPEVGAVNFNILHALLHVLIQQVELLECKVEFRGNDSERIQNVMANSKPGPTLTLTEYIVTPGKDQRKVVAKKAKYKKARDGDDKKTSKEEVVIERELRVIEQRKDSKEEPLQKPPAMITASQLASSSMQTVVVVEPTVEGETPTPHVSVALSRVHFDNMEEEIEKLKDDIRELKELPANIGLIDALRNSVDRSSPVLDMFQILTLVKRVEATETGINKLASMLEDLAREQTTSVSVVKRASDLQVEMQASIGSKTGLMGKANEKLEQLEKRVTTLEESGGSAAIKEFIEKGGAAAAAVIATGTETTVAEGGGDSPPGVRLNNLESKFAEYTEHMMTMDSLFNNQVTILQNQFTDLEKEIGEIVERLNAGFPAAAGDTGANQEGVRELYNKFLAMQSEMEKVTATATKLTEDKEERQTHIDALLEQIELLKTIKADREDLEDALADKADTCAVNRKVSHDQFESACDDLSRGLEDALGKLTQQEQLWQQALDDIQREIGTKLDKMELTPLRDFVNNKLKQLQDRLKALAALKKDTEAAGTKSKFLRNVNCISCDKEVIMRKQMDPTTMPPPPSLPPTKSMAPYLAYELDALRKQQKCAPHSRNMNHFETAMAGAPKMGATTDDHICNRYCGGSHTTTTPQQRVARLGHFLQQWGPESQGANEGQLRGTDGQWYKTREGDNATSKTEPDEPDESYFTAMRSRPSMVVHGGIVASRGVQSLSSKVSEQGDDTRASTISKGAAQPSSQARLSSSTQKRLSGSRQGDDTRASTISKGAAQPSSQARLSSSTQKRLSGSRQGSAVPVPRASVDAASKRSSRASAAQQRPSQTTQKRPSKDEPSKISFKEPQKGDEGDAAPAPPPTAEEPSEAPPPSESEGEPPAEGEAEAPVAPEGEAEAPPEEDAPPTE